MINDYNYTASVRGGNNIYCGKCPDMATRGNVHFFVLFHISYIMP